MWLLGSRRQKPPDSRHYLAQCIPFLSPQVPIVKRVIARIAGSRNHAPSRPENLPRFHLPKMQMGASDYMRTRVWHGFITDAAAGHCIPYVGPSQVLWGSDFPHFRSIGLEAQSALKDLVGALPQVDQEKVVGGNAARVSNID